MKKVSVFLRISWMGLASTALAFTVLASTTAFHLSGHVRQSRWRWPLSSSVERNDNGFPAQLEDELNGLRLQETELKTMLSRMEEKEINMENELSSMKNELAVLSLSNKTDIRIKETDLKADIRDRNADMDRLKADIRDLKADIRDLKADIRYEERKRRREAVKGVRVTGEKGEYFCRLNRESFEDVKKEQKWFLPPVGDEQPVRVYLFDDLTEDAKYIAEERFLPEKTLETLVRESRNRISSIEDAVTHRVCAQVSRCSTGAGLGELKIDRKMNLIAGLKNESMMELDGVLSSDTGVVIIEGKSSVKTKAGHIMEVQKFAEKMDKILHDAKEDPSYAMFKGKHILPVLFVDYIRPDQHDTLLKSVKDHKILLYARNGSDYSPVKAHQLEVAPGDTTGLDSTQLQKHHAKNVFQFEVTPGDTTLTKDSFCQQVQAYTRRSQP